MDKTEDSRAEGCEFKPGSGTLFSWSHRAQAAVHSDFPAVFISDDQAVLKQSSFSSRQLDINYSVTLIMGVKLHTN